MLLCNPVTAVAYFDEKGNVVDVVAKLDLALAIEKFGVVQREQTLELSLTLKNFLQSNGVDIKEPITTEVSESN